MKINLTTSSQSLRDALRLVAAHVGQFEESNDCLSLPTNRIFLYLLLTLHGVIDPFEDQDMVELLEEFDCELLDQIISLILELTTNPLIKPLLASGEITDISLYNDIGKLNITMERKRDGTTRPVPTFKTGFF